MNDNREFELISEEELRKLDDNLKKRIVAAANTQAAEIVEKARKEADALIAAAQKQAGELMENKNTTCLHTSGEFSKLLCLGHFIKIYGRCMTVTAVCDKNVSLIKCFVKGLYTVHRKYGRELFMSEFLRQINALDLSYKYFS